MTLLTLLSLTTQMLILVSNKLIYNSTTDVNLTNPTPDNSKLFVDTGNNGYLIYSSSQMNHDIVVELLTNDYLYSSGKKSKVFDSKTFVEAPTIFKHIENSLYYVFTSYCFCHCANGGDVLGRYSRTEPFVNCVKGTGNDKESVIHAQETVVFQKDINIFG